MYDRVGVGTTIIKKRNNPQIKKAFIMSKLSKLNPFSLENIESKAEKKFRTRTFKEEYRDHRLSAMVFKLLFSAISIYFATYFFQHFIFKSLVPNLPIDSTNSTKWFTGSTIWLISAIIPVAVEVIKHLSVPIVVNSIIRAKWAKIVVPFFLSTLTISASYYFTIEGSAFIFDKEDIKMSEITTQFKIKQDSVRDYYGKQIEKEKELLKELQDNTKDNSLIYSTIKRIDKLEGEYTSTRGRMEKALRLNQNKDSIKAYFKPLLNRIETKINDEKQRSDGLLSSNEKITMNTILSIEKLQNEQEAELAALDTNQKEVKDTIKTDNNLLLDYIYIVAIAIETLILLCIIFISYYDYQITRGDIGYRNLTELEKKYTSVVKELSDTKQLLEETIMETKVNSKKAVPLMNNKNSTDNGTTIRQNGTALNNNGTNDKKQKVTKKSGSQKDTKIAYLLKEGYTYAQIVEKLGVSKRDIAKVKKEMV